MTTPAQLPEMELAYVLFMDIVGYSKLPIDEQVSIISELKQTVSRTPEFRAATEQKSLISMHTGDGMALAFFGSPEVPVRCALEVARTLKDHPRIKLRMGVNSGPVYRIPDIKGEPNVAGGGINFAQRVMDCGDQGHILLSASIADVLRQHGYWAPLIQELGVAEVKHQERISIFNLYTGAVGNPAIPERLAGRVAISAMHSTPAPASEPSTSGVAPQRPADSTPTLISDERQADPTGPRPSSRWRLYAGLGVLALMLLAFVVVRFALGPKEQKLAPIITPAGRIAPASRAERPAATPPERGTVPAAPPASAASHEAEGLAGCWLYNTIALQMHPDGRVTGFLEARWNHEGGNRYTVTWPKFVDTVKLSADGKSLTATSNFGFVLPAQRTSGEAQGLAGTWQWNNAMVVVVSNEGAVSLGPFRGRWTALGGESYRIAWTHFPVDQLVMSADGQTVSGQNQYGIKAAGTRIACSD